MVPDAGQSGEQPAEPGQPAEPISGEHRAAAATAAALLAVVSAVHLRLNSAEAPGCASLIRPGQPLHDTAERAAGDTLTALYRDRRCSAGGRCRPGLVFAATLERLEIPGDAEQYAFLWLSDRAAIRVRLDARGLVVGGPVLTAEASARRAGIPRPRWTSGLPRIPAPAPDVAHAPGGPRWCAATVDAWRILHLPTITDW